MYICFTYLGDFSSNGDNDLAGRSNMSDIFDDRPRFK